MAAPHDTPTPARDPDSGPVTDPGGGRRRTSVGGWIALVVLIGASVAWSGLYLDLALGGYRATHHGVPGTVVITKVTVSGGGGEGGHSVDNKGDFTPSGGGPTRHGVRVVTNEMLAKGATLPVLADRPDPARVYFPGSRDWIGNLVMAAGPVLLALLIVLIAAMENAVRRIRRSGQGEPVQDRLPSGGV